MDYSWTVFVGLHHCANWVWLLQSISFNYKQILIGFESLTNSNFFALHYQKIHHITCTESKVQIQTDILAVSEILNEIQLCPVQRRSTTEEHQHVTNGYQPHEWTAEHIMPGSTAAGTSLVCVSYTLVAQCHCNKYTVTKNTLTHWVLSLTLATTNWKYL